MKTNYDNPYFALQGDDLITSLAKEADPRGWQLNLSADSVNGEQYVELAYRLYRCCDDCALPDWGGVSNGKMLAARPRCQKRWSEKPFANRLGTRRPTSWVKSGPIRLESSRRLVECFAWEIESAKYDLVLTFNYCLQNQAYDYLNDLADRLENVDNKDAIRKIISGLQEPDSLNPDVGWVASEDQRSDTEISGTISVWDWHPIPIKETTPFGKAEKVEKVWAHLPTTILIKNGRADLSYDGSSLLFQPKPIHRITPTLKARNLI